MGRYDPGPPPTIVLPAPGFKWGSGHDPCPGAALAPAWPRPRRSASLGPVPIVPPGSTSGPEKIPNSLLPMD
jgi:hypothetical protein